MAQLDYRYGVDDDGDNHITPIVEEVYGKVPGVVPGYVNSTLKSVIEDFYKKTYAWRTFIEIGTLAEAEMPYDLNPLADRNLRAHAVMDLTRNGLPLRRLTVGTRTMHYSSIGRNDKLEPKAYYCDPATTINFLHKLPDDGESVYEASVAIVPKMKTDELPQWLIDAHKEAFMAGTLHRLHNEISKPYTDPYKAMYYGKEWRFYINQHKTIADKNYGTAEHDWHFPRGTM